jgi:hypothetical protein
MYSLSFLIVELETARTTLLDVFEVSDGKPNWTTLRVGLPGTNGCAQEINDVFSQIDDYGKGNAH